MLRKAATIFFTILTTSLFVQGALAAKLVPVIIADTFDKDIGIECVHDIALVKSWLAKVKKYTGLSGEPIVIQGHDVEPSNMLDKLENLPVEEDDVVVFYFSGHGYRTVAKLFSPWPYLYFSSYGVGLKYDDVIKLLRLKEPRLLITFADVCNKSVPLSLAPPVYKKAIDQGQVAQNYRHLFLESRGTIHVTSAKRGQYAWGVNEGAIYTLAFMQVFEHYIQSSRLPVWEEIMQDAATVTDNTIYYYFDKHQKPYQKVKVKYESTL